MSGRDRGSQKLSRTPGRFTHALEPPATYDELLARGYYQQDPSELAPPPSTPIGRERSRRPIGPSRPLHLTPQIVRLSDVTPEDIEWLWAGRIPFGKVTLLDGDPGTGKSTLCVDLAARLSTGRPMPDGTGGGQPADVLILSGEDGLADTVLPRLVAAGADTARVHAFEGMPVTGEDGQVVTFRPAVLPGDVSHIEAVIEEHGVRLVIVDVLLAFLSERVNSHRDQDVRGALVHVKAMAERTGAAVVALRHLNKAVGGSAMYRGGGSIGINGAARSVLVVGSDPGDPTGRRKVLASTKSNLGAPPDAWAYRLTSDGPLSVARVEWLGPTALRADDLVAPPPSHEEHSAATEASSFVIDYLQDGPRKATELLAAAKDAGHSERTVQRARRELGIVPRREGFGPGATSWWDPPANPCLPTAPIDAKAGTLATMQSDGRHDAPSTKDAALPGAEVDA